MGCQKGPPDISGGPFSPSSRALAMGFGELWECLPVYFLNPSLKDSPILRAASAMVSIIPLAPSE